MRDRPDARAAELEVLGGDVLLRMRHTHKMATNTSEKRRFPCQARSQDFEGEVSAGAQYVYAHAHCLTHYDVTPPLQITCMKKSMNIDVYTV